MKYVKILFAIALVFTMCSAFSLKKDHSKTVYAFGIAASFTDTVVDFKGIKKNDSISELNKTIAQMLSILNDLGLKPSANLGDDYEDL